MKHDTHFTLYFCCFLLRLDVCLSISFNGASFIHLLICVLFLWLLRWWEVMFNKGLVGFYLECRQLFGYKSTWKSEEMWWGQRRVQIMWRIRKKGRDKLTFFLSDSEQRKCQNLVTFGIPYKDDWHQLLPVCVRETGLCIPALCVCVCVCAGMTDMVNWKGQLVLVVWYRQADSRKM